MPKLTGEKAKAVNEAESTSFEAMEPHTLHYRLVDVTDGEGPKGPYWNWEYECVEAPYVGRKNWNVTSLSQDWALQQSFEAYGVDPDTDTDDLVGQVVKLKVSQRIIQGGNRKGEMGNQVDRVMKKDDDFAADEPATAGATSGGAAKDEAVF